MGPPGRRGPQSTPTFPRRFPARAASCNHCSSSGARRHAGGCAPKPTAAEWGPDTGCPCSGVSTHHAAGVIVFYADVPAEPVRCMESHRTEFWAALLSSDMASMPLCRGREAPDNLAAVTASVLQIVKDVVGTDVDAQQPLMDAGLDSLGVQRPKDDAPSALVPSSSITRHRCCKTR